MVMDQKIPDLNDQPVEPGIGRVSGLDSFMDSSGTSKSSGLGANATDHPSMLERLAGFKATKAGIGGDRKVSPGVRGVAKDIEKPKRNKKAANIVATIQELEEAGLLPESRQAKKEVEATGQSDEQAKVVDGESPAKRSRCSPSTATPLTGAHEEPHQEK